MPIGSPITNTRVELLDAARRPVQAGEIGELYVGGAALAREYLYRPDLAAPGPRLFRTGDLARRLPDQTLEYPRHDPHSPPSRRAKTMTTTPPRCPRPQSTTHQTTPPSATDEKPLPQTTVRGLPRMPPPTGTTPEAVSDEDLRMFGSYDNARRFVPPVGPARDVLAPEHVIAASVSVEEGRDIRIAPMRPAFTDEQLRRYHHRCSPEWRRIWDGLSGLGEVQGEQSNWADHAAYSILARVIFDIDDVSQSTAYAELWRLIVPLAQDIRDAVDFKPNPDAAAHHGALQTFLLRHLAEHREEYRARPEDSLCGVYFEGGMYPEEVMAEGIHHLVTGLALGLMLVIMLKHVREATLARACLEQGDGLIFSVVSECARLVSPVSFIEGVMKKDIGKFAANSIVRCPLRKINRGAKTWFRPDEFQANRFDYAATRDHVAFGVDDRNCVARTLVEDLAAHLCRLIASHTMKLDYSEVPYRQTHNGVDFTAPSRHVALVRQGAVDPVVVVGAGASGMMSALQLARRGHRVVVVEGSSRVGGHAHTSTLPGGQKLETAFMLFTPANSPHFMEVLKMLNIRAEPLCDVDSASSRFNERGSYASTHDYPFSEEARRNLAHFLINAPLIMADEQYDRVTCGEFFAQHRYCAEFIGVLFPGTVAFYFAGHPLQYYLDMPVRYIAAARFHCNDAPLFRMSVTAEEYTRRFREFLEGMGVEFRLASTVLLVTREPCLVEIRSGATAPTRQSALAVVCAVQPKQILDVLGDLATAEERAVFSRFPAATGTIVVHQDRRYMPSDPTKWAHWNTMIPSSDLGELRKSVDPSQAWIGTRFMGTCDDPIFATLAYDRDLVVEGPSQRHSFSHVQVTPTTVSLRHQVEPLQMRGRVAFTGSWLHGLTLHESAMITGVKAAEHVVRVVAAESMAACPVVAREGAFDRAAKAMSTACSRNLFTASTVADAMLVKLREMKGADEPARFSFYNDKGEVTEEYNTERFYLGALGIANAMTRDWGIAAGDRVMLVYEPGLEFFVALFACFMAGAVAVVAYPPSPSNLRAELPKFSALVALTGAKAALTSRRYYWGSFLNSKVFAWPSLAWHVTTTVKPAAPGSVHTPAPSPEEIAFIQSTSGSTDDPKGVMISHRALLAHCRTAGLLSGGHRNLLSWVPQYHDMGLVMMVYSFISPDSVSRMISPATFIKHPRLYAKMIHLYRPNVIAGPCFMFSYMSRKVPREDFAAYDWSSVKIIYCGGERVIPSVVNEFYARFACTGIDRASLYVNWGLAEATCAVTFAGNMVRYVNHVELQRGVVSTEGADTPISSCGKVPAGSDVRIVDPVSLEECAADRVGEVWVRAATMGSGYWGRPELSQETFNARIAGDASGKPYLRTGDLGFMMDNQLFLIGRMKDTIIVRGRNVEPADIERAVNEVADENLRAGCAAAFSLEGNEETTVVVVCELRQQLPGAPAYRSLAQRIRASVMSRTHTFVNDVCFTGVGGVGKTTSGKIRRRATSKAFSEGALKLLYSDNAPTSYVVNAWAVTLGDIISQTLHEATNMVVAPDDPFESFMDSLQFVQFVALLSKRLSVRLELNVFSEHNTITALDGYLQREHSAAVSRALGSSFDNATSETHSVIPHNVQTGGGKAPMFLLPPFLGFYTYELFLAANAGDRPTYVLVQSPQHASRTLQALARSYVDVIRSVQPRGPYVIAGYSFGASLALCVAKLLDPSEVEAVVCVDDVHRPSAQLGRMDQDWRSLLRAVVSFMKLSATEQQAIDALLRGDGHVGFDSITHMVESLAAQGAGRVEQVLALKAASLKQLCYHLRCFIRNLEIVRGAQETLDHERGYGETYLGQRAILVYSRQDNPHPMASRFAQSIPIDGSDHLAIVSPEQVAGYWPRVCQSLNAMDPRVKPRRGWIGRLWAILVDYRRRSASRSSPTLST